jgi:phage shock protein A
VSLLGRIKNALSAKANAALDKAIDPEKEMDLVIAELEATQREARKELLGYKTTSKQIEQDIAACDEKIATWEQRAMEAVKLGDDELAKQALAEKRQLQEQRAGMVRDRNEAASYAIQLNRSRKLVETRLQILKLKKGTMAQQIAAARAGGQVFGDDGGVWEKMKQAEQRIEEQAIAAEVDELLGMEDGQSQEALAALEAQTKEVGADVALAELKTRMDEAKQAKLAAAARPALPPKKTD